MFIAPRSTICIGSTTRMSKTFEFMMVSDLTASVDVVWRSVSTIEGVNIELAPLARMTYPAEMAGVRFQDVPVGQPLFTSVILFLGIIPFDRHHLRLESIEAPNGFHEHSQSLVQQHWIHRRSLTPVEQGCRITDHIQFVPRLWPLGYLLLIPFRIVFWNRHRNLRRIFNGDQP